MGSLDRQRWDALWQRLGGNPPADAFDALLAAMAGPTGTTTAIATSSPAWSTSTAGANGAAAGPGGAGVVDPRPGLRHPAPGQRGRQRRQHRALARPGRAGGAAAGPARTDHGHLSPGAAGRRRRSPGGGSRPRHPRRAGAGLRTLRGGRPRRIRLGAGTAVPRRARQLLRQLLEQPALYHCEPLRQRWEAAARANLRGALERLEQPA